MKHFLANHQLYLTPLSPIHIGCGEDFEPTNYVIDDEGLLYGFDPSRAALNTSQHGQLLQTAKSGSLLRIQQFFRDHVDAFTPHAHVIMPVCSGVARLYRQRIGRTANTETSGAQVFNKLEIERHVYTGALQQPFIPGSSFKGAMRTAWLDALNAGEQPRHGETRSSAVMEKRLLDGDFQTSPLRLLKVPDFMPVREPEREVLFAVNRKKREVLKNGQIVQAKGIAARKDCILPGQYRLFAAHATLPALLEQMEGTDRQGKPLTPSAAQLDLDGSVDLVKLAQQSNQYHQQRLQRELAILDERGLVQPNWKRSIEQLLDPQSAMGRLLQAGKAFLVRLGRYGGAESKTLTGIASIKIMGAKGSPPTFESATKTVWLAAQDETDQKHLIPFGWAIVEIAPQGDCQTLKQWCEQQSQGRRSMAAIRANLQADRRAAEQKKETLAREAAEQQAAAQAKHEAAEQRTRELAAMTPQMQAIEKLHDACQAWAAKLPPHGNFSKRPADPNKPGLYQDAHRLVKQALESADWSMADRVALADMLQKALPTVITGWDAREQRKKLKLSQLRGET